MPELRIIKASVALMVGISVVQTIATRAMMNDLKRVKRRYNALHDASMYLFEIIEANNIELSEFDEIAIHALVGDVDAC